MTAAARIHAVPAPRPGELLPEGELFAGRVLLDERSAVLASRIDAGFLAEAGWDPGTWVLTLPAEHPLQGKRWLGTGDGTCRVSGCPRPWMMSGQPLCPEHLGQRERLGVRIADFTARPDVIALPSHGTCPVPSCPRQVPGHDAVYRWFVDPGTGPRYARSSG